jgi:hypothetical protein
MCRVWIAAGIGARDRLLEVDGNGIDAGLDERGWTGARGLHVWINEDSGSHPQAEGLPAVADGDEFELPAVGSRAGAAGLANLAGEAPAGSWESLDDGR